MSVSPSSVLSIINNGGSVVVKSSDFNPSSLQSMAISAKNSGAKLTIKVTDNISPSSLQSIAVAGKGAVTIDFS